MSAGAARAWAAALLLALAWLLALPASAVAQAAGAEWAPRASERLKLVRQRGALIVGVKTDYPPFGMLDKSGAVVGLEIDLARDVARRLGVPLTLVGVTGSNRLQKLQEGVVDIVIATMGDTGERRQIATLIEPDYYSSGVTLFLPPGSPIRTWADTRNKTVCATQGSYFNRTMQQRYLLTLQIYNNARDAKLAVRDGRCVGYLFDNTALLNDLSQPEWAGYQLPLPPTLETPWAMAIAARERGTDFEKLLGDTVADWHRSGFLVERERAWGMAPSRFLQESQATWARTGADGQPVCRRGADGTWPAACRNPVFVTSTDVSGFARLGLWLNETTGLNLTLLYDPFDRLQFFVGLGTTLLLTLCCVLGSLAVGLAGAVLGELRLRWLAAAVRGAAVVARMTPPLLVMYLVLFGIGSLLMARHGLSLSAMAVAVGCLCVYTGAGVMTAMRDAAEAIRHEDPAFRLRWATLPRAARLASGGVTAALVNVAKATMMASAVAVPELLSATTAIISERGNVGVMMNALLLTFLLLIFAVVRLLRRLERALLARMAR